MKITPLNEYATQLTFFGLVNVYLVRESDGFTLIDTAVGGRAKGILRAAQQVGAPIRRILLTHAHGDHIGSLDKVYAALGSNVDVAISERDAPLLHKDKTLREGEPQKKLRGSFPGAKTVPTHLLTDGELFGSLRCIGTAGHTPGHMSFLDERTGTLFTGDAMHTKGGLSVVTKTPWWFPLPKLATWDKPMALASAKKLASFPVTGVAPGHGKYVAGGPDAILRAVQQAEVR